jgi:hypothetical protein
MQEAIPDAVSLVFRGFAEGFSARRLRRPHPLSVAAAVETQKKFLPRPEFQIAQHDLFKAQDVADIAQPAKLSH